MSRLNFIKQGIVLSDLMLNNTIDERVTILEIQVADIQEDLTELEGDVNFLFDEKIIQDERLLELEQISDEVVVELAEINANILGNQKKVAYFELEISFICLY